MSMKVFERLGDGQNASFTYHVKDVERLDSVILGMLKNNNMCKEKVH